MAKQGPHARSQNMRSVQLALLALRALLLLVRHPGLRSIGLLSRCSLSIARGWAVPRKSVVGALRTLELLLRHLEQVCTSLAALAPAICPVENCCGEQDVIQFFLVVYPVFLFTVKSGFIS